MIYQNDPLLNETNRQNYETKEMCAKVLQLLEEQGQILIQTDKILNESKIILDNSNKILKNMTWYGWLIGWIPFKSLFTNIFRYNSKEDQLFIANNPHIERNYIKNEESIYDKNNITILNYIDDSNENILEENSKELKQLEKDLLDLKWIGSKIGEQLDMHNNYIDKINDKSQILIDKTKNSIIKETDLL
jgi:hypothetical protein